MVVYDVFIEPEPVTVRVRYRLVEHPISGLTIMDVMTAALFLPGFGSAVGTVPYAENGGERAFTSCAPDRRLVDGELIELVHEPAVPRVR